MTRQTSALLRYLFFLLCLAGTHASALSNSGQSVGSTDAAAERSSPIGVEAPPLTVATWLRGKPVPAFERGRVYLVDIWAVWCAPCVAGLPHLAQLQERYGRQGLRVIALTGPDTLHNTPEAVDKLLKRKVPTVNFAVGYDEGSTQEPAFLDVFRGRSVAKYLSLARADGIPVAFVVDRQSRIAWIGPSTAAEPVVTSVLAGTWDSAKESVRRRNALVVQARLADLPRLLQDGKTDEVGRIARGILDGPCANDATVLWLLAGRLSSVASSKPVVLDLALTAARRADELCGHADLPSLVALARVRALRHEWAEALAAQQSAVKLAEPPLKQRLQKTLDEYQSKWLETKLPEGHRSTGSKAR